MLSPRVTAVRYINDHRLELTFADGLTRELDFGSRIVGRGGLFQALEAPEYFAHVRPDTDAGTIAWPNGVDFCPDVLYDLASA